MMLSQIEASQACYRYLEFDSDLFGVPIGRVLATVLTDEVAAKCCELARINSVKCLYFLCSASDSNSIRVAEQHEFQLVDVRMAFTICLGTRRGAWLAKHHSTKDMAVRPYIHTDLPTLRAIASTSYGDTRFYQDPHFSREGCNRLYELWVEKSCNGYADTVLVADAGGEAVGFITCHLRPDNTGNIGLVGVGSSARGQGVGQMLVHAALDWFAQQGRDRVTVVTQERNVAAQRLYQRCGFSLQNTEIWFHRWSEI